MSSNGTHQILIPRHLERTKRTLVHLTHSMQWPAGSMWSHFVSKLCIHILANDASSARNELLQMPTSNLWKDMSWDTETGFGQECPHIPTYRASAYEKY